MAGPHLKGGTWGKNSQGKRFQISKGLLSQVKGNPQTDEEIQNAIQDVREKNNKAESERLKQRTRDRVEAANKYKIEREDYGEFQQELKKDKRGEYLDESFLILKGKRYETTAYGYNNAEGALYMGIKIGKDLYIGAEHHHRDGWTFRGTFFGKITPSERRKYHLIENWDDPDVFHADFESLEKAIKFQLKQSTKKH